ncbi:hypothetical protein ACFOEP_12715 [Microbacterium amylolyticum]
MDERAGSRIPIWITEFGWTTGAELGQQVSYDVQAERLIRAQITALGSGVEKFFWYDLVNDSPDPNQHEGNFGMFEQRRSGIVALPPKPAAYAQALLIAALDGREEPERADVGDDVFAYRFGGDDPVHVVWSLDGDREATIETDTPVIVTSAWGHTDELTPDDGSVTLTVSATPLFVSPVGEDSE